MKVKVAVPALGPSSTTNSRGVPLSRWPGATPLPKPERGRRGWKKMSVGGELEEELVFAITTVEAAVVGLIHPGFLRYVRAPAPPSKVHIATAHSCFLGTVHDT